MSDPIHCPDCGAALPAGQPLGLCARCALKGALDLSREDSDGPAALAEAGDRIGRYKLLEKIGEGGCGVVYMAEQEEPVRRRVALKIIKPGMDTREVVARFEAERQALALMEHAHIAKVFDGGTTEAGRPYFVMELVRGLRITDYCDQKNFSTSQRLDLFMQVCHAVQHAHQKGIIHRDLKPSNILVTVNDGVPVPKVIDFGIAKAAGLRLTDKTFFTRFQQLIGTPAYMSPEQAEMTSVDIDTRSDIYSLGVLLYELLTGKTPFDAKELLRAGVEEMLRTIRETEPVRPSARLSTLAAVDLTTLAQRRQTDAPRLIHLLRGDLDWIVMKCLEKDRARRYETASGLAADIHRHLEQEPVVARPPTAMYRFQKFVRRNRGAVAAGSAIGAVLVMGIAFSAWQWRRAEHHAVEQERERIRAEDAVGDLKIQRAQDFFAVDDAASGLAYLADVLRQQPTNRVAAHQLMSALTYRTFALRLAEPLTNGSDVTTSRLSPDGQRVITVSWDSEAKDRVTRVRDARTGQVVTEPAVPLKDHPLLWTIIQYTPDGERRLVVSSSAVRFVSGRSNPTLAEPLMHGTNEPAKSALFSPDGQRFLTASAFSVRLWDARTSQVLTEALMHESNAALRAAVFSPDGQRLFTASSDSVRLWDARTGQPLTEPLRPTQPTPETPGDAPRVTSAERPQRSKAESAALKLQVSSYVFQSAQFTRDGTLVAVPRGDGSARIFDGRTGQVLIEALTHGTNGSINAVLFSPDGRRLLTGASTSVRIWHTRAGKPLTDLLKHETGSVVNYAYFSPDGRRVLTVWVDETARLWDAENGRPVGGIFRHEQKLTSAPPVQFSPEGQRLLTISKGTIHLLDASTGQPVGEPIKPAAFVSAHFSPNGQLLLTRSDGAARIWDARTGRPVTEELRTGGAMFSADFTADGQGVVTYSWDEQQQRIQRLWGVRPRGALPRPVGEEGYVSAADFSPNGERVLVVGRGPLSSSNAVRILDAHTGRSVTERLKSEGSVYAAQFSLDGDRMFTISRNNRGGHLQVWDARTGQLLGPTTTTERYVGAVRFSQDGHHAFTVLGGTNPWVYQTWNLRTGRPLGESLPLRFEGAFVGEGTKISRDGRRVLVMHSEPKTGVFMGRIWDTHNTNQPIEPVKFYCHSNSVITAEFSPDGEHVVTSSADHTARIWNARTGQPVTESLKHGLAVRSAQFSPDGKLLVTASRDGTARIWDARSGQALTELLKHHAAVDVAEFSPDGQRVLTVAFDRTVRVWDVRTGQLLTDLLQLGGETKARPYADTYVTARFSPDGQRLVTTQGDGVVQFWEVPVLPLPVVPWLAELAEAIGGKRLNRQHAVEFVPDAELRRLHRMLAQSRAQDFYTRWAKWFFADVIQRTISPYSSATVPEYIRQRVAEDTFESLHEAIRLDSTNAPAFARLARKLKAQTTKENPGRDGELDWCLQRALKLDSSNALTWQMTSERLAEVGDAEKSLEAIERSLQSDTLDAESWRIKGELLEQSNELVDAKNAYSRAIELATTHPGATNGFLTQVLLRRANVLRGQGMMNEARADFERAKAIPARGPTVRPQRLDLAEFYNASFQESWRTRLPLSGPPLLSRPGFSSGAGFDGRGVVQLSSPTLTDRHLYYPEEVRNIPVNFHCGTLRFLIGSRTAQLDVGFGARFVVRWEDGQTGAFAVSNVFHRWGAQQPVDWANPRPEVRVAGLDFGPSMTTDDVFLAGITAEPSPRADQQTYFLLSHNIPMRNPKAGPHLVDLERHYNFIFGNSLQRTQGSLAWAPSTPTLGGIEFDVRAMILVSRNTRSLPPEVTGIAVGQICRRLHFLHAAVEASGLSDGIEIGRYVIHLGDNSAFKMPLVMGEHLADWFEPRNEGKKPFVVAWRGQNEESRREKTYIRLFKSTWENPQPGVAVRTIDFQATHSKAAPFLVAVTAEP